MSQQSRQLANRLTSCTNGFAKSEASGKKRRKSRAQRVSNSLCHSALLILLHNLTAGNRTLPLGNKRRKTAEGVRAGITEPFQPDRSLKSARWCLSARVNPVNKCS